jgi:energy-coupling factor transporter ATP-binding protein EcfA2
MTPACRAPASLTPSQRAAAAKIAAAVDRPGGVALLCGPQGVGKSTVLDAVVEVERQRGHSVGYRDLPDWVHAAAPWPGDLPDVVVADAAHRAADGDLARLLASCRLRASPARLVLAGEGRLLTLVSRDTAVERAIHLRASLRPLSRDESSLVVVPVLTAAGIDAATATGIIDLIHEIGGGIPAAMLRLADLAAIVAAARPDRSLSPRDIEAIHRRLSPLAA